MNTACLCLDTHETCHSVTNIQPVLYVAAPDWQMGWPPDDLWHSTFREARPWILSSGLHHSQMFCQNGCRTLEPTWARCCLKGDHMTSADIPTDFVGNTRNIRFDTAVLGLKNSSILLASFLQMQKIVCAHTERNLILELKVYVQHRSQIWVFASWLEKIATQTHFSTLETCS